jgi:hypothetical protein
MRVAAAVVTCGLLSTAACFPVLAGDALQGKQVEVRAGGIQEECAPLDSGQALWYQFQSSESLDFNIHSHRGSRVHYSVDQRGVRKGEGTFRPDRKEVYCLMWGNPGRSSATLQYQFRVH